MKSSQFTLLLLVIILIGGGWLVMNHGQGVGNGEAHAESTYARVIRTRTLRCGYALWPGSTDRDPNTGKMSGWVPAVTEQLGKKLGLKIEWVTEYLIGQESQILASGKVDALCSSEGPWTYSDATIVDWAHPIVYFPIYLMIRADETRFHTLEDFNKPDVIFSAMDGDISSSLLDDMPQVKRLDIPQSGDPSLLALNIEGKKADAVFLDKQTILRISEKTPIHLKPFSEEPFTVVPASFAVRKGDAELLQMFNQGFDMLRDMGILKRIMEQQGLKSAVMMPAKGWQPWDK